MAVIGRLRSLERKLEQLARRAHAEQGLSAAVGYTQSYAVHVHENLASPHRVGQAKFLEQPTREMADELGEVINRTMRAGGTLKQGLLLAAFKLLRASQLLVPVDTGALKASGYARIERAS